MREWRQKILSLLSAKIVIPVLAAPLVLGSQACEFLKKDGCVRRERMPVMLSLCYGNLRSFYMRTSTDSSITKAQLSQKFVADSPPAPYPGFFLCVANVTLLRDPFSAGSSAGGCRLCFGWGEPQAGGGNC